MPGLPAVVLGLDRLREADELAAVERWQLAAHGERAVAVGRCQLELAAPAEGAHERRMAAVAAEAEGAGGVGERQVEAGGLLVEAVGDAADQPGRARAEHAEPEPLDVG